MKGGKRTDIHVRGFSMEFTITMHRDEFISLEQACEIARKELIETAIVIKVVQYWREGELEIYNEAFKRFEPFQNATIAKKYLTPTKQENE